MHSIEEPGWPADRIVQGDEAKRIAGEALWNSAADPTPAMLVRCGGRADVQRAVRWATDRDVPISVLSGGHDWAGRSTVAGGMVLDLRGMTEVAVEANGASVTAGGGTTSATLLAALPEELAVVGGICASTGVVGVATGGGYGKLNRRFGLAADNILRAEVVLADGSVAVAGERDDAELLWALRGGGCNFGVVTSVTLAAHRLAKVLTASIFVPLAQARAALLDAQAMLDAPDDGLSILTALATIPRVGRGLILSPMWAGDDEAEGERRIDRLTRLDGARPLDRGWRAYRDSLDPGDNPGPDDYRVDAHAVPRFDDAVADLLVEAAAAFPSDHSAFILHDLFGAATRVPPGATAFARREPHINVVAVGVRDPGDVGGARRERWLADVRAAFAPWRERGGYPNFLGPRHRADALAFYGEAVPRLKRAKAAYDPLDRFSSNPWRLG